MALSDSPDTVLAALRLMRPEGRAAAVWVGGNHAELYPEEAAAVGNAVESRRVEFARGRACARRALGELGAAPRALPVGAHRQPIWPRGYLGSITHCQGLVAAVAATDERLLAVGLDAEPARPLPGEVRSSVLHTAEMRDDHRLLTETVVFSAKESVHKALFPSSGIWLDFLDVEIALDDEAGSFSVKRAPATRALDERIAALEGVSPWSQATC